MSVPATQRGCRMSSDNGRSATPPGGVGLRAAPRKVGGKRAAAKVVAARAQVSETIQTTKEERRRKIWDKLDEAKQQASRKLDRVRSFQRGKGRKK